MIRKKIIIYLRKSRTDNQFESIEEVLQRHERQLQDFCMRYYGEPIPESNIYREVVSGETISDRPMMIKLLEDVEKGDIDAVVVVEPQRLSRGSFGDIDKIVNTFKYTNTIIITPSKTYDLNNKYDRKFFEQELLRGNDYLEYVKEILTRGRIRSTEDGLYVGAKQPFGYDKKKLKKGFTLVPNQDAETVKLVFKLFLSGSGCQTTAKKLIELGVKSATGKQWTSNMVRNILTNDIYIGVVTWGRRAEVKTMKNGEIVKSTPINNDCITAKGLHEPIIPQEDFDAVQNMLKSRSRPIRTDKQLRNALAGIVYCEQCGKKMIRRPYPNKNLPDFLICNTIGCPCVASELQLVEERTLELLKVELSNYKFFVANYEEEIKKNTSIFEKEIKKIEKELSALQEDLQKALVKFNRDMISQEEYYYLKNYVTEEINRLKKAKEAIFEQMQNDDLERKRTAIPILESCIDNYNSLSIADKNEVLQSILEKAVYNKTVKAQRGQANLKKQFTLELFLRI